MLTHTRVHTTIYVFTWIWIQIHPLSLRKYFFLFLSPLNFREASSLLCSSAPENNPMVALQYFPCVTQLLGGSGESYQLPLINRVGMLDIHLPEQRR